ncbi:ABC transporter substrate-binding protein [Gracilibacillus xinjiangensis]|uniref:ABC transporter substrate-binding protein n=1 Tax=Gracilibacillus xinjiangensis TaxID=1193282 RepID=A0ABV8WV57_9BACI
MKKLYCFSCIISLFLLVSCDKANIKNVKDSKLYTEPVMEETVQNEENHHLEVWTFSDIFQNSLPSFQEKYPDLDIEIKVIDKSRVVNMYLDSLVAESTPDLFVIPDDQLGTFLGIGGLENLLSESYYDEQFLSKRPEGLLDEYIHDDEMVTMPLLFFPYVTFYRKDILEQYGYPHDPISLSNYISESDHWLRMARTLAEDGYYIAESEQMLIETALRTSNFFESDYNYILDKSPFNDTVKTAVSVSEEKLSPYLNIWDDRGKEALANNQLVMIYMGSFVTEQLMNWLPEQKGKWGVTTLPFDLAGIDRKASMSIAISSNSPNKEIAWEFVKHMSNDMLKMYQQPITNPYFINDNLQSIYWKALEKNNPGKPNILDREVRLIWELALKDYQNGEKVTDYSVNHLHEDVMESIRQDQEALKNLNPAD